MHAGLVVYVCVANHSGSIRLVVAKLYLQQVQPWQEDLLINLDFSNYIVTKRRDQTHVVVIFIFLFFLL